MKTRGLGRFQGLAFQLWAYLRPLALAMAAQLLELDERVPANLLHPSNHTLCIGIEAVSFEMFEGID